MHKKLRRLGDKVRRKFAGSGDYTSHFQRCGRKVSIAHRGTPNDYAAMNACFDHNQYSIPDVYAGYSRLAEALYQRILVAGKKPLIIDCGANIGAASAWFAATYPQAQIVAVEPAADNFAYLVRNAVNLEIEPVHAGIDAEDGVSTLQDPGFGPDGYRTDAKGSGQRIEMVSVDTILRRSGSSCVPFFLKVDIEGFEASLFGRSTEALAQFPVIAVELHDWLLPGEGTSVSFFRFQSDRKRDYVHQDENVFSFDYACLRNSLARVQSATQS